MPRYAVAPAVRSLARLAGAAVICLVAIATADLAGNVHWSLAALPLIGGVGGVLLVVEHDEEF